MSATPWPAMWPCHKCGDRGYKNLGKWGWCQRHLGELYATFNVDAFRNYDDQLELLRAAAHDRILSAPETEAEPALLAWGERLQRAVESRIVTEKEARAAWTRAVNRVAA